MATEISNEPNSVALVIVQGSRFSCQVTITDAAVDFTGYTARSKIINNFTDRTVIATLTCTVDSAGPGQMVVTLSLTTAQTAALSNTTAGERRQPIGFHDLEIVDGSSEATRYMQGTAYLSREATVA